MDGSEHNLAIIFIPQQPQRQVKVVIRQRCKTVSGPQTLNHTPKVGSQITLCFPPFLCHQNNSLLSPGLLSRLDCDMACCSSDKPGPPLLPSPANDSRVKYPDSVLNPHRVPGALSRVLFVYTLLVFVCLFLAFHGCDVTCRYGASQQPPIW